MKKLISVLFVVCLMCSQEVCSQDEESFKQLIMPSSGIWWNSEQSGTGVTMQFSREGFWFVSMFLYDESGNPVFYTLQGNSVDFSFDRTAFTEGDGDNTSAYAKINSPMYKSVDGRCLGCDYQQPENSTLLPNVTAEIYFYNKGSAKIILSGAVTFEENIYHNLFGNQQIIDANKPLIKVVHLLGNGFDNTAIVEMLILDVVPLPPEGGFGYGLKCLVCEDDIKPIVEGILVRQGLVSASQVIYNGVSSSYSHVQNQEFHFENTYAILDSETAESNDLPTQIILQQFINH